MKRRLNVFGIAAAVTLLFCAVASAQADRAVFSFKSDVTLGLSGYMLPPGQYTIERVNTTEEVFWLRKGDNPLGDPIATILAWDTHAPKQADLGGTEAVLKILDPTPGETARSLEGFSIRGEYYKIRDVLAIDSAFLTSN